MDTKNYGNEKEVIGKIDFADHLDASKKKNGKTATIKYSFLGTLAEAIRAAPQLGSFSELLQKELRLTDRQMSTENNQTVSVTLNYAELELDDSVVIGPITEQYKLSTSQQVASILDDPKYKNELTNEKVSIAAQDYLSGVKDEAVFYKNSNGELSDQEIEGGKKITWKKFLTELGIYDKKILQKIRGGDFQYRYSTYDWTVTTQAAGINNAVHKLNDIVSNPPGPAPKPEKGMKWIVSRISATKNKDDNRWKIETTYSTRAINKN